MWVCATGGRHSKSLERGCVYGGDLKLYTVIILAWDGFASPAETEATCIWKVGPQIVVGIFLKVCIMSVE